MQKLLAYNQEDCQALKILADFLSDIKDRDDSVLDIDHFIHSKKGDSAKVKNPLHNQLETILRFAHADYNKNKITFRAERENGVDLQNITADKVTPRKKKFRRVTRQVQLPEARECRKCGNKDLWRSKNKTEKSKSILFLPKMDFENL